ncbi:hypothetical protein Taro_000408, partial [Colocasia esculenta]|nr:hypothetical protein [Colocasia esculenta]
LWWIGSLAVTGGGRPVASVSAGISIGSAAEAAVLPSSDLRALVIGGRNLFLVESGRMIRIAAGGKLWRKVTMELSVELQLLAEKWKLLLAGLIFQYIHGLAARGVHYLHHPGPILQDIGFAVLPELGKERSYISESVFTFIFISFILWSFHPFVFHSKRFYTVLLWCRVLAFLVASQVLRIITFYATQLPGPNYHCPQKHAPLIFECTFRTIKQLAWLIAVIQSLLIISSRKHYTVDVTVAWYTVNLVVFFVDKKLPEMPDRSAGAGNPLLPVSLKERDSKPKEEMEKLLNGNPIDGADRRQRSQVNGKMLENGNHAHAEVNANGK